MLFIMAFGTTFYMIMEEVGLLEKLARSKENSLLFLRVTCIQLFQLTLSGQSIKL